MVAPTGYQHPYENRRSLRLFLILSLIGIAESAAGGDVTSCIELQDITCKEAVIIKVVDVICPSEINGKAIARHAKIALFDLNCQISAVEGKGASRNLFAFKAVACEAVERHSLSVISDGIVKAFPARATLVEIEIEIHPKRIGGSSDILGALHAEVEILLIARHLGTDQVVSSRVLAIDVIAVSRIVSVKQSRSPL